MSNKKEDRSIRLLSSIDDEIIDKNTEKRYRFFCRMRQKRRKRVLISALSAAAGLAVILSALLILIPLLTKQVPVYTGMTASGDPAVSVSTGDLPTYLAPGGISGDYHGAHNHLDHHNPFPSDKDSIGDAVSGTLQIVGGTNAIYYTEPNSEIYITVHFENPDNYLIQGFTINGVTYADYMFEKGSDMENITVKITVGEEEGILDYTIDDITYIDRGKVKYVEIGGERTIKIGVSTDKQPSAALSAEMLGYDSVMFKVTAADALDLIGISDGKLQAVLYDGDQIVALKDIDPKGTTTVTFEGLSMNRLYQYAVVATYDALNGDGQSAYVLASKAFYTRSPLLFDDVEVGADRISFTIAREAGVSEEQLATLALYQGDTKLADLATDATLADHLTPATTYRLVGTFLWEGESQEIALTFTTRTLTYTVHYYGEALAGGYELLESVAYEIGLGESETPVAKAFAGFSAPDTVAPVVGAVGMADVSLYYTRNSYQVTFYEDGSESSELLPFGTPLTPATAVGKEFAGWYEVDSGDRLTHVPARHTEVYAVWVGDTPASAFSYTGTNQLTITGLADGQYTSLQIPAAIRGVPVTAIGDGAFANNKLLRSVTIPASVTYIDETAFYKCTNLTAVHFEDQSGWCYEFEDGGVGVTGNACYALASGLDNAATAATLVKGLSAYGKTGSELYYYNLRKALATPIFSENGPDSLAVTGIANGTYGLLAIPATHQGKSVTAIRLPATLAEQGIWIVSLSIPSTVSEITGLEHLQNGLQYITLDSANTAFTLSGNCLIEKATKTLLRAGWAAPVIPADGSVTRIGTMALVHGSALFQSQLYADQNGMYGALTLPATVTEIGRSAFAGAPITSLTMPSVHTVGEKAFAGCIRLSAVSVRDLLILGDQAFYGCIALQSLDLKYVEHIGAGALVGCSGLNSLALSHHTSWSFNGTKHVMDDPQANAALLTAGNAQGNVCTYVSIYTFVLNAEQDGFIVTGITETVGTALRIPAYYHGLPVVQVGQGSTAFEECLNATSLWIPATVKGVSGYAFRSFQYLSTITVDSQSTTFYTVGNALVDRATGFVVLGGLNDSIPTDSTVKGVGAAAYANRYTAASLTVPDHYLYLGDLAFSNCSGLTSLSLPATVTTDAATLKNVFDGCRAVSTITLTEGNGGTANYRTQGGALIDADNVMIWGVGSTVEIPVGVVAIADNACAYNEQLIAVTIPNTVTSIGNRAFTNCSNLAAVDVPGSVKSIGENAFVYCTSITSFVLHAGLESIGGSALRFGTSSVTVTLPDTVTCIGVGAFAWIGGEGPGVAFENEWQREYIWLATHFNGSPSVTVENLQAGDLCGPVSSGGYLLCTLTRQAKKNP